MFPVIETTTPDGRRPERAAKGYAFAFSIAANGHLPTTLPEPK
jgi:hypothetical protein